MIKKLKFNNIIFPVWLLWLFPLVWLIVIPANFIIDSLVLLACLYIFKLSDKLIFYKKHILKIYLFGMLSDIIGSIYMFLMMFIFKTATTGFELYLTIPGVVISGVMIFIFNYFITFKNIDKKDRLRLSIIFAVVTAPYTFLIPFNWLY